MKQVSFDTWLAGKSYDRAWSCLSVQEVTAVSLLRRNHSGMRIQDLAEHM